MTLRPIILLDSATADTIGDAKNNGGGLHIVVAEGDFGGGNVTLQTSIAGSDWQDVYDSNGELLTIDATNNYASRIVLVPAMQIRATLAGATASDITIKLA
jgi:hypothetical protein